ncbi:MAG: hypothetical protein K2O56_06730, partial [Muribaculaceae bacterium]|nr:hypothetical protein [Muribaculaceae bacterium]
MRKSLLAIFSLLAVCVLGISARASAFSFTVNWDNPGAVRILEGGTNGKNIEIDAAAKSWTGTEAGGYTFTPAPGYVILNIHEKYVKGDTKVPVETNLVPKGSATYGQTVYKWIGSLQDGAEYTVTTKKLSPAGTVTVDVKNGLDKFNAYFTYDKSVNADYNFSTFTHPVLKKGVQEVEITDQDKFLCIENPGTVKVKSVKLNGVEQSVNRYKSFEVPVKNGDKVEILVYDEDPAACDVQIKFTNGESCITSVSNTSSYKTYSAAQIADMGNKLTVDEGDNLLFYFDGDYNMESVSVDGEKTALNASKYALKITKSCVVEFTATAKVYTPVEITLYLKNAEGLVFRRGAFDEDEEITISEGEELAADIEYKDLGLVIKKGEVKKYTAMVSGKRPQIFWSARPGYWVPKAVMLNPEDKSYTWPSPGVMAQYCPLYLEATEVEADHQLVIFFEGAEKEAKIFVENPNIAGRLPLKGLDEEFYVPVGYTMSAYDPDYHKYFSTGKVGGDRNRLFQVFVNGRNVEPAEDASFALPVAGDPAVVKIFSREAIQGSEGLEIKTTVSANVVAFETVGNNGAE